MARNTDWLKGQLSKEHNMLHSWVGISVLPLPDVGQAGPLYSFSIYLKTFAIISSSLSVLILSTALKWFCFWSNLHRILKICGLVSAIWLLLNNPQKNNLIFCVSVPLAADPCDSFAVDFTESRSRPQKCIILQSHPSCITAFWIQDTASIHQLVVLILNVWTAYKYR